MLAVVLGSHIVATATAVAAVAAVVAVVAVTAVAVGFVIIVLIVVIRRLYICLNRVAVSCGRVVFRIVGYARDI